MVRHLNMKMQRSPHWEELILTPHAWWILPTDRAAWNHQMHALVLTPYCSTGYAWICYFPICSSTIWRNLLRIFGLCCMFLLARIKQIPTSTRQTVLWQTTTVVNQVNSKKKRYIIGCNVDILWMVRTTEGIATTIDIIHTHACGGFLKWGYPQSSSFLDWDFPWNKPTSYWGSPRYGNPYV